MCEEGAGDYRGFVEEVLDLGSVGEVFEGLEGACGWVVVCVVLVCVEDFPVLKGVVCVEYVEVGGVWVLVLILFLVVGEFLEKAPV